MGVCGGLRDGEFMELDKGVYWDCEWRCNAGSAGERRYFGDIPRDWLCGKQHGECRVDVPCRVRQWFHGDVVVR